jgi:RNA 3'-terminal phosphate cyclase (ATP)
LVSSDRLSLFAETTTNMLLGGSALGSRSRRTDEVGAKAAQDVLESLDVDACVDQWAQDQIIIFMALAEGRSRVKTVKPTEHTLTAIFVAEKFTGVKFKVEDSDDGGAFIECEGIGFSSMNG